MVAGIYLVTWQRWSKSCKKILALSALNVGARWEKLVKVLLVERAYNDTDVLTSFLMVVSAYARLSSQSGKG